MRQAAFAVITAALLASACAKNTDPPPPTSGSPFAKPESGPAGAHRPGPQAPANVRPDPSDSPGLKKAKAMFASVCATCHGMDGTGHGPAAANLTPPPRNYTDANWQSTITDDQIKKTILLGGNGVGKSPMMPAQPQLKDEPDTLDGLVKIIRGFATAAE